MEEIITVEERLKIIKEIMIIIVKHKCFHIDRIFINTPTVSWHRSNNFKSKLLSSDFENEILKKTLSIIKTHISEIYELFEKHNNNRNEIISNVNSSETTANFDYVNSLYNYRIEYSDEFGYPEMKIFRKKNEITEKFRSYRWVPVKEMDQNIKQYPFNGLKDEFTFWTNFEFLFYDYVNKLNNFIINRVDIRQTNKTDSENKTEPIMKIDDDEKTNPVIFSDTFIKSIHREFDNYLWKSVDINTCKDWFRVKPRGKITLKDDITLTAFCYLFGKIEKYRVEKPEMGKWMSFHIGKNNYSKLKTAWELKDKQGNIIVCNSKGVKESIDKKLLNTVQS